MSLDELTELLKASFGEEKEAEAEWKLVVEAAQQTDGFQKDGKVRADDLVRLLLHPGFQGSDSPLDAISINLAQ